MAITTTAMLENERNNNMITLDEGQRQLSPGVLHKNHGAQSLTTQHSRLSKEL